MVTKNYLKPIVGMVLLIVVLVLGSASLPLTLAQGGGANRQAAAAGTAFTYQGSLAKSGSEVSDTCNFNFALYDAASGGAQVGSTVSKTGIAVANGIFTVDLDFGGSAFTGDARYLDVQVQCSGDASMQQLSPRTALTAAPYALGLRPGAVINGSVASGSSLKVVNGDNSTSYGVYGQTDSDTNGSAGIYGIASSTSAKVYGVYGQVNTSDASGAGVAGYSTIGIAAGVEGTSNSSSGIGVRGYAANNGIGVIGATNGTDTYDAGVFGRADGASGITFGTRGTTASSSNGAAGVYGSTLSTNGVIYGVLGETSSTSNGAAGVKGESTASSGTPYGMYGLASDTGAVTSYGVYGESKSSIGTGVGGTAPTNGVYGESTDTTGTTWGVYGKSNSASGYGVYSSGNAHVEGALTWKAMTSTVSIPGLAFQPFDKTNTLTRDTSGGGVQPADSASTVFYAPIQLPNNATVTKLTFYWADSSNLNGSVTLYSTDMQGSETFMAAVFSSGGSSGGGGGTTVTSSSSSTSISAPTIDNSTYSYYLYLNLPTDTNGATIKAYGVTVEYSITQPY